MKRIIVIPLLIIGFALSACSQTPAAQDQKEVQDTPQTESPIPSQTAAPTAKIEAPVVTPAAMENPLSSLKGKMVKDQDGYLILLGFVNTPNAAINYQFPESYQYPHARIKDDFRILDGKGAVLEFEEIDPGEMNLYAENPLGEGIFDPRVFRILQKEIQGPLTLEMVNLIKVVNLTDQPDLPFTVQFGAGFPSGKNKWDINQAVNLIPDHPFILRYFDATVFNDHNQGKYGGPQNTFFSGSYYVEAAGIEGISFSQIVPAERQTEWPNGGGGSEQTCPELFANCVISDAGLLHTTDNAYNLKITAYRLIIHGPWQVQSDLPE